MSILYAAEGEVLHTRIFALSLPQHTACLQATGTAAIAATPPTPALLPDHSSASPVVLPDDKTSPLELRTRDLIARTPLTGPSPATSDTAAGTSLTHTPQSKAQVRLGRCHQVQQVAYF